MQREPNRNGNSNGTEPQPWIKYLLYDDRLYKLGGLVKSVWYLTDRESIEWSLRQSYPAESPVIRTAAQRLRTRIRGLHQARFLAKQADEITLGRYRRDVWDQVNSAGMACYALIFAQQRL